MFVHQSPRRHSARLQNAYEDGTDEDEQHLLLPADRHDHQELAACDAMGNYRSSPQDHHPRYTQLHATVRNLADRQCAANDVPFGPNPNAPLPAYSAGENVSGTEHAEAAYSAGEAALPPLQHTSLPASIHAMHRHATRATQEPLEPLTTHKEAYGQGRNASSAAWQPTAAACRNDHQQRTRTFFDSAGGRGLSSSPSEPIERAADLEQQSAFYRDATPCKSHPYAWKPLDLPTFDGNIRKYRRFREAFEMVYGSHADLTPSHKLLCLRMHLSGEPLKFAEQYMVTDKNYARVIDILDERYGTSRVSHTLWQDLIDIRPASEELQDLRRLHEQLNGVYHSLRSIGETLDGNGIYEKVLANKLPRSVRLDLVRNYGYIPDSCNAAAFLECLRKYCRDAEWSDGTDRLFEAPTDEAPALHTIAVDTSDLGGLFFREIPELTANEPAEDVQRAAVTVTTTTADKHLQERRTCPLCGLLHSAADCTVYATARTRTRRALKLKLCLLCLREGHPAVSCPRRTTEPCKICRRGQHSKALCLTAADEKQSSTRHPSQLRATRGPILDPEVSDQQRHSRTRASATMTL
ncbi:Zinc knuckle family protein [Aphelenchoides avenae]|nr:Zinc knuckle family protein [Aphelenchus avenae]